MTRLLLLFAATTLLGLSNLVADTDRNSCTLFYVPVISVNAQGLERGIIDNLRSKNFNVIVSWRHSKYNAGDYRVTFSSRGCYEKSSIWPQHRRICDGQLELFQVNKEGQLIELSRAQMTRKANWTWEEDPINEVFRALTSIVPACTLQ
jgi:hypothetical protein